MDVQGITKANQILVNKVQRNKGKETSESVEMRNFSNELTAVSEVSGLIGIQKDFWTDSRSGMAYASARMNRVEGAARYTAMIQENEALISALKESAQKASGTFAAYENLSFAANVAELTDNFYTIRGVLQPEAASQRPTYGSAEAIRALMREQPALIVVQVEVTGDVNNRIAKAFASVFSKRGFRTGAAAGLEKPYTLAADFQMEDVSFNDPKNKYIRFVLTASLIGKDGAEVLSFSENSREGHTIQTEVQQRAIRSAEKVITEGGFAKEFDAYLDSL